MKKGVNSNSSSSLSPVKTFCPQFQHSKSAPAHLNEIWQTILVKNSTYKIIEQAKRDFLKNGTWFSEQALKKVCQKIKESPHKIYTSIRLKHIILAGEDGTPYAIYHDGKIGKGSVGCIKLAQNLITKELCVVKTMLDDEEKALDESNILKKLNLFNGLRFRTKRDDTHKSYLFMTLLPGITLHQFKRHCKNDLPALSCQYQAQILRALLEAIQFLIQNHINHADVSSRNILIDPLTLQAHFIDFGDACITPADGSKNHHLHYDIHKLMERLKSIIVTPELDKIMRSLYTWHNLEQTLQEAITKASELADPPKENPQSSHPTIKKMRRF